jgi:transposase
MSMNNSNSTRAIAQKMGISKSTVHRRTIDVRSPGDRVRGLDGKSYPATGDSLVASDEMVELRAQGWSYRQLAKEFDVSPQTVMRMLRTHEPFQVSQNKQNARNETAGTATATGVRT